MFGWFSLRPHNEASCSGFPVSLIAGAASISPTNRDDASRTSSHIWSSGRYVRLLELASKDFPMTVTDPPPGSCYGVEHTDYQAFNRQFKLNNTASIF